MTGGTMMIIVNFTGWLKTPANEVFFKHVATGQMISGEEYLKLDEAEQEDYTIMSMSRVIKDAEDVNWDQIWVEAIED